MGGIEPPCNHLVVYKFLPNACFQTFCLDLSDLTSFLTRSQKSTTLPMFLWWLILSASYFVQLNSFLIAAITWL